MLRTFFSTAAVTLALAATASGQTVIYSNTTTFSGSAFPNGGATAAAPITRLVADDINVGASFASAVITSFTFSVANLDTVAFTARPRVRFYAADGTGGAPGTILAGFSFGATNFNPGTVGTLTTANGFTVPANGQFWAGITFDNVGGTATVANLNTLGQGIYGPPTVGASADTAFQTTTGGSFLASNPAGSAFNFGNATDPTQPITNFGWAFTATPVPEPATTLALAGFAAVGWMRLRRRTASA